MKSNTYHKAFLAAAIIIAVALVVFIVMVAFPIRNADKKMAVKPSQQKKTELPVSQTPAKFPAEVPIEKGAKILQNYNISDADSLQATRVFETTKSLDENFNLYKEFFTKNGWTIINTLNQPQLKVISATKEDFHAQVTIAENAKKVKTVDLSFTQRN